MRLNAHPWIKPRLDPARIATCTCGWAVRAPGLAAANERWWAHEAMVAKLAGLLGDYEPGTDPTMDEALALSRAAHAVTYTDDEEGTA
jgi:hypothetical protein